MATPQTIKDEPKRPRVQTTESKVLHVRALPGYVTEQEIVDVVKDYGSVKKVLILPEKNQAFVEMQDASQAADVLAGLECAPPTIRHKKVYWQYSDREQVEAKTAVYVTDNRVTGETQGSLDAMNPTVILLAISNVSIPVSLEALQQIGSSFGTIYRIITFNKGLDFHALLEYSRSAEAVAAKEALDGKDLYENCCHIRASFSNKQTLQVKTNDHRSWDYTLQMPPILNPFAFYGSLGMATPDPFAFQQYSQHALATAATPPNTFPHFASANSLPSASSTSTFPAGAPSFAAVAAGQSSSSPPASLSGPFTVNMIDCFGSQPFQGQPTAIIYLENQKSFDDRSFLSQLTRELNTLVILLSKSSTYSPERPEFGVCWMAPGWSEGDDPHALSAALSASHFLFSSRRASRSATLLPRSGPLQTVSTREENSASRVVWLTVTLSSLDAFTEEPWFRSDLQEKSRAFRFVQGLQLDLDKVLNVERNGHGVLVVQVSDEASVLRFAAKFLPAGPEKVSVLVVTAGCSSRQWQQDAFDSTSRVFVVEPPSLLLEDCGGAAASTALACYWFPRTNKAQSAFRNPSSRPGVICTRLQSGPAVANLPFDRVEVGGQAITTMQGELTL